MEQLSKRLSERRVQVGFLVAFCLFLYFFNLGRWDLWNPDEPRYGQVAREIVNGGDWVLMHNNGKMYTDKPPALFLVYRLFLLFVARFFFFLRPISLGSLRHADGSSDLFSGEATLFLQIRVPLGPDPCDQC